MTTWVERDAELRATPLAGQVVVPVADDRDDASCSAAASG